MSQHVWVTYISIFNVFFKAHEVLIKILKNQDDTIKNSILVTWYSLMELPYDLIFIVLFFPMSVSLLFVNSVQLFSYLLIL